MAVGGIYKFKMSNIKNPFSTETSQGFFNILLSTYDNYRIAYFPGASEGITNQKPAEITFYETYSDDEDFGMTSTLHIKFKVINALPIEALILIKYPVELTLPKGDNTHCTVLALNIP